jgi:hypothetical protein
MGNTIEQAARHPRVPSAAPDGERPVRLAVWRAFFAKREAPVADSERAITTEGNGRLLDVADKLRKRVSHPPL